MLPTDALACIALSLEAQLRERTDRGHADFKLAKALTMLLATSRENRCSHHTDRARPLLGRLKRMLIARKKHALFTCTRLENASFPIYLRLVHTDNDIYADGRLYNDYQDVVFLEHKILYTAGRVDYFNNEELTHFPDSDSFVASTYDALDLSHIRLSGMTKPFLWTRWDDDPDTVAIRFGNGVCNVFSFHAPKLPPEGTALHARSVHTHAASRAAVARCWRRLGCDVGV